MKKDNLKKTFRVENELTNDHLSKVMGGTACSKFSVTISLAQATLANDSKKQKDSDSDADSVKTPSQTIESK